MMNIISSCTNSKKMIASKHLQIANYSTKLNLDEIIKVWKKSLESDSTTKIKALELYKGGAWKATIATKQVLATKFKTKLYIASAGYGLIDSEYEVHSYDSTFASGTVNSVSKFSKLSNKEATINWWNGINCISINSFESNRYTFIILPHDYLIATQDFIKDLIERNSKNVFIFTANQHKTPKFMENNIINFDSKFNSYQAGVISNMLQRAVLWLSNEIIFHNIPISHSALQSHIEKKMSIHDSFVMPVRIKLSEEDIKIKIRELISKEAISSASHGLRRFRKLGFACEQKRFGKLYKQIKSGLK